MRRGIGSASSAACTMPGSSSTAAAPRLRADEKQEHPLALVELLQRLDRWRRSCRRTRARRASVRRRHRRPRSRGGPRRFRCCSGCREASRRTRTASRRGVAKRGDRAVRECPPCRARVSTPAAKACSSVRSAFGGSSSVPSSTRKSRRSSFMPPLLPAPSAVQQREAERLAALVVRLRHRARERAHAQDVALPLGHRDGAARIEQVEGVRGLEHLLVGRQRAAAAPAVRCRRARGRRSAAAASARRRARSCTPTARPRSDGTRRRR